MNKIEKIKAEIDRLKNELIQEVEKGYKSEFDEGRISAFEDMITFIDSLEEEPVSNDLEAGANYVLEQIEDILNHPRRYVNPNKSIEEGMVDDIIKCIEQLKSNK